MIFFIFSIANNTRRSAGEGPRAASGSGVTFKGVAWTPTTIRSAPHF
jgi:hypothetical protein